MLTYNFTNIGSDSLYEYLYKCIKNDILSGNLKVSEKLPSKRSFAKNLGISVITVENAYGLLLAEGYIYSLPKKGFFVADVSQMQVFLQNEKEKQKNIGSIKTEREIDTTFMPEELAMNGIKQGLLADFSSNQTESKVFPFSIWTKTMRSVMNDNQPQLMINPPCGGILPLRQNIASYLKDFRGMDVKPEQIIVGAGTEYLHSLLIQLLGEDIRYGVENPGYPKIAKIYQSMKVAYDYVDLDGAGVSLEQLEQKGIDVIHISPAHHFPTGMVMPISRRYELLGWVSKADRRYIIEDDYDSELRLTGRPIPTLQSIDVSDKVIYMNTFTKTLCSTVRISYMVLPESLTKRFYKELSFYSGTVSNFEQYTLAAFMENGSFEKHLNRLRNYYQNKRDAILEVLEKKPLGNYLTIKEKEAGVHFLMHIKTNKSEKDIVEQTRNNGIKLVPLSVYYKGENASMDNTYVMNYSSVSLEDLDKIADLLYQSIVK